MRGRALFGAWRLAAQRAAWPPAEQQQPAWGQHAQHLLMAVPAAAVQRCLLSCLARQQQVPSTLLQLQQLVQQPHPQPQHRGLRTSPARAPREQPARGGGGGGGGTGSTRAAAEPALRHPGSGGAWQQRRWHEEARDAPALRPGSARRQQQPREDTQRWRRGSGSSDGGSGRSGGGQPGRGTQVASRGAATPATPQRRPRPAPAGDALPPSVLTAAISSAGSLAVLQQLLKTHGEQLQQINVCAAYKAVVRLAGARTSPRLAAAATAADSAELARHAGAAAAAASGLSSSAGAPVAATAADGSAALAVMRQLSARMQAAMRVARPWDLAQAAWACSKLHFRDEALLEAIAAQAQRKAAILLPQDITQLASAYARLAYPQPALLRLLQQQALAKAGDFAPWALVHTCWALSVARAPGVRALLQAAARELQRPAALQQLQPFDFATLLWLMAGERLHDAALLDAAVPLVVQQLGRYTPPALAQTLLACAALECGSAPLAAAGAEAVLRSLHSGALSPKHGAQAVFALAKLGAASPELLAAAAAALGAAPQAYPPGALCMLCWAFLVAGQPAPRAFMDALVQRAAASLPHFTADQVVSLVRGLQRAASADPSGQADAGAAALLSAARALLVSSQQLLRGMSTPVLAKLITSTAQRYRHAGRRYSLPADGEPGAPGELDAQPPSQPGPGQAQEQEREQLLQLLQHCEREWLAPGRRRQMSVQQAEAVAAALASCELQELAAGARGVLDALGGGEPGAAAQQAPRAARAAAPQPLVRPADGHGSWADSFVAGEG